MQKSLLLLIAMLAVSGCLSKPTPWQPGDVTLDGGVDGAVADRKGDVPIVPPDVGQEVPDATSQDVAEIPDGKDAAGQDAVDVPTDIDQADVTDVADAEEVADTLEVEDPDTDSWDGDTIEVVALECDPACQDGGYCIAGQCRPDYCEFGLGEDGCCLEGVWVKCDPEAGLEFTDCTKNQPPYDSCGWKDDQYECGGEGQAPDDNPPMDCCEPDCEGKECGTDGCWGICGECTGPQEVCTNGVCQCQPACDGKDCGDDGCGGQCGTCTACGKMCQNDLCVFVNCEGVECGDDSCGGSCGLCQEQDNEYCSAGICECMYVECLDACCDEGEACFDDECCEPLCEGKACGDDGCGGVCGECTGCEEECDEGLCKFMGCEGKLCGDDGCEGECGVCTGPQDDCIEGACICQPDCDEEQCGDDGCSGVCGTCGDGNECIDGICWGSCGDGVCGDGESCTSCVGDCGACDDQDCDPLLEKNISTGSGSACVAATAEIPAGTFWMGCNHWDESEVNDVSCGNSESPIHEVYLDGYEIDLTEVTVDQYKACVADDDACPSVIAEGCSNATPTYLAPGMGQHALNCVTWAQAEAYCGWAGKQLCTEAQWEKAARGGCELYPEGKCKAQARIFPWGNDLPECTLQGDGDAVFDNCYDGPQAVAEHLDADSPYGMHDMAGNVGEWVKDWYGYQYYFSSPYYNPEAGWNQWVTGIFRGGGYNDSYQALRVSWRGPHGRDSQLPNVGIRCCAIAPDCVSDCAGKNCGSDGCGGTCGDQSGDCLQPQDECMGGVCVCVADCEGKDCGDDGCGGSCGVCPGPQDDCVDGECICDPHCVGKDCGSDGCEGTCGECVEGQVCTDDECLYDCGDGLCLGDETCFECPADCGKCCGNGAVDPEEQCDDGNGVDWDGCTECEITELQVNTFTAGPQQRPAVATLKDGGFVVVWQSKGQDVGEPQPGYGVIARIYNTDGSPRVDEFSANVTESLGQENPAIAALATGGFVVVWTDMSGAFDTSSHGIVARRFSSAGAPASGEFQVNTTWPGSQLHPNVAAFSDGGFMGIWLTQGGQEQYLHGQRFDSSGVLVGPEFDLAGGVVTPGGWPSIAVGPSDDFVATWFQNSEQVVRARRFEQSGAYLGEVFDVSDANATGNQQPDVAYADTGQFLVAWSRHDAGTGWDIKASLFSPTAVPAWGQIDLTETSANNQSNPAVAFLSPTQFVTAWDSANQDGSPDASVFFRIVGTDQEPVTGELPVNTLVAGNQHRPAVSALDGGRFVVAYEGCGAQDGEECGIFARIFDSAGAPLYPCDCPKENQWCNLGECSCVGDVCGDGCCADNGVCIIGQCCTPDCVGNECGDDGCGGDCGLCGPQEVCSVGQCACAHEICADTCCAEEEVCFGDACCLPDCAGKECGDDLCGGSCGACGDLESCNNSVGACVAKMVDVPEGEFWMGCNSCAGSTVADTQCTASEQSYHEVHLTDYKIDISEVTADQYEVCFSAEGCAPVSNPAVNCTWQKQGKGDHPINCVTLDMAAQYCQWAGKSLCTEAQWEKGARGGCEKNGGPANCKADSRKFPWGNDQPSCTLAAIQSCDGYTQTVCSVSPDGDSPYGLCDMAGNVFEWVADKYQKDYYCDGDAATGDEYCPNCGPWPGSPTAWSDPMGPAGGTENVTRGGSVEYASAHHHRVSYRSSNSSSAEVPHIGFRCCSID